MLHTNSTKDYTPSNVKEYHQQKMTQEDIDFYEQLSRKLDEEHEALIKSQIDSEDIDFYDQLSQTDSEKKEIEQTLLFERLEKELGIQIINSWGTEPLLLGTEPLLLGTEPLLLGTEPLKVFDDRKSKIWLVKRDNKIVFRLYDATMNQYVYVNGLPCSYCGETFVNSISCLTLYCGCDE
jgi:hypothetical protein